MSTERTAESSSDWHRHLPSRHSAADVDLAAGETLPAVWLNRWTTDPQRTVICDPHEGWLDGAQLLKRSQEIAARLAAGGVEPGDRVLMSGPSSARLVAAHAALLAMGAVVVPLNGAYRASEVEGVVADCRPRAALIEGSVGAGVPQEWSQWIHDADSSVMVAAFDAAGLRVGAATAPDDGLLAQCAQRRGSDPALIGYTSGTTGQPKGAVLSHANLLASVRALELAWRWTPDDVLVLALPLFHMHGLGVGLHGTLTVGARAVLIPEFEPDTVFDAIDAHDATLFFGVPTMYSRLVASSRAAELSALRLCVSGSAPMPAELHDAVRRASAQHVVERYGMTETVMLVSNPHDGQRRAGTVGIPLPGVELRLDRSESERQASDETGVSTQPSASAREILVRGPNVFGGYWERPEANAESFEDGWFRTGDLGSLDADGYLRIVGRAKELIISGGFNVYPREVEEVIAEHPDVTECAVGGEPDPEWGEVVVAYVVAERDFDDDELKDFVGERLAFYKRPRRTHRRAALPRNALGKLQRHELG
ncbi:class I adenylate-forming enzyme family protein [Candidatus Poriferisodalis sp.]|uniref:class I adenylate-forming enzyme family protein n=1 Tax=Candidatus Poriferisodalis sp. TaxID=3101277 RepID=UPI003D108FAD